jgi:PAS domain-containing protein
MSAEIACPATGDDPATLGAEAAEHERQLRELLEFSPAAIGIVDETGRLLFHNARLREIFGYSQSELHLFDTRLLWHDLGTLRPSTSTSGMPSSCFSAIQRR